MMGVGAIAGKYRALAPALNERTRRLWAGAEARALGRGGVTFLSRLTGLDRNTIARGMREADGPAPAMAPERVRRPGGGRKRKAVLDPSLMATLESLVDPLSRGDPESPLRWTCKSTRNLSAELKRSGYGVSHTLVGHLLGELGYRLQANRKTKEGWSHPDRNAQFEHVNAEVAGRIARGEPAISVDTKKKESPGEFRNGGREWRPSGNPEEVNTYDFVDLAHGKAIPYGVYDLARNAGWVSVGVDHDTAEFAVNTIRQWWRRMGRRAYPKARSLVIVADSGGSNGARLRLWKTELQKLANETGLTIRVMHLPPGTSKWNKIEHRLFSFISRNWRGRPLLTHATVVNLIAATRTATGLKVRCVLDTRHYRKKIKVSDTELAAVNLVRDAFHGEWNYAIHQPGISSARI